MIRKDKKTRKKRGYEMHSGLRRRGSGNRGGCGNAGQGKKSGGQKETRLHAQGKKLGRYGFTSHAKKKAVSSINLRELMKHVKDGRVNAVKLGYDKVLSRGEALKGVSVKARYFSDKAKAKIEKANGKAVVM